MSDLICAGSESVFTMMDMLCEGWVFKCGGHVFEHDGRLLDAFDAAASEWKWLASEPTVMMEMTPAKDLMHPVSWRSQWVVAFQWMCEQSWIMEFPQEWGGLYESARLGGSDVVRADELIITVTESLDCVSMVKDSWEKELCVLTEEPLVVGGQYKIKLVGRVDTSYLSDAYHAEILRVDGVFFRDGLSETP